MTDGVQELMTYDNNNNNKPIRIDDGHDSHPII